VEGYVRRIMVNRNISLWRRFRRETTTDRVPEQPVAPSAAAHDSAWAAVLKLPPRQRAVIALRYYEDLTEAETAEVLGCSVGTVKSQASRAMSKLRLLVPSDGGL
jgi:RNA polymerase sigma factor (sigma-70 family)